MNQCPHCKLSLSPAELQGLACPMCKGRLMMVDGVVVAVRDPLESLTTQRDPAKDRCLICDKEKTTTMRVLQLAAMRVEGNQKITLANDLTCRCCDNCARKIRRNYQLRWLRWPAMLLTFCCGLAVFIAVAQRLKEHFQEVPSIVMLVVGGLFTLVPVIMVHFLFDYIGHSHLSQRAIKQLDATGVWWSKSTSRMINVTERSWQATEDDD